MIKVGIPRALLFYQQYPMWRTFFEELGAEVSLSPATTRGILSGGASRVVAETCLPTKIFLGHCIALGDSVDFSFVPSIKSIERNVYNCSKFVGLPDLAKQTIRDGAPILDIDIDMNLGMRKVRDEIHKVGRRFTRLPWKIDRAMDRALSADREYQEAMRHGLTPLEAIEALFPDQPYRPSPVRNMNTVMRTERPLVIALIGHPYNIYDEFVNHNLVGRLRAMNVRLVTPEMISLDGLNAGISTLVGKPYFTYEREVVGAGGYYLMEDVDGVAPSAVTSVVADKGRGIRALAGAYTVAPSSQGSPAHALSLMARAQGARLRSPAFTATTLFVLGFSAAFRLTTWPATATRAATRDKRKQRRAGFMGQSIRS